MPELIVKLHSLVATWRARIRTGMLVLEPALGPEHVDIWPVVRLVAMDAPVVAHDRSAFGDVISVLWISKKVYMREIDFHDGFDSEIVE